MDRGQTVSQKLKLADAIRFVAAPMLTLGSYRRILELFFPMRAKLVGPGLSDMDHLVMLTDWELWACARQQIVQHGEDAAVRAAMRSDKLLAEGDLDGHRAWLAIVDRIHGLSSATPDETRH